ncbi:MAG: DUF3857 domain-containing protein [Acidobacteriota bacterium]|nr:DUF3857 domain-containing protein [Acidobacteriota bacterium]
MATRGTRPAASFPVRRRLVRQHRLLAWLGPLAVGLVLCLVAAEASAAVIRQRTVELRPEQASATAADVTDLAAAGRGFFQEETLEVLLEDRADLESWRRYPLVVDEQVEIEELEARVLDAEGRVVAKAGKRKLEEAGAARSVGELYTSRRLMILPLENLEVGHSVHLRVLTRERPVFAGTTLGLQWDEPQLRLRVRVAPGFSALRWNLRGDPELFHIRAGEDGSLELVAEGLEAYDPPPHTAEESVPLLQLAWGPAREWQDVGRWYEAFAPAGEPASSVQELAQQLTAASDGTWARAEVLTEYVQQRVRYEAVQIGEGGWRPSPAEEVAGRGWGDCKDKSRLLLDLLAAVGIRGHMALLQVGDGAALDPDFPTAFQFNHAIVAIPASELAGAREDGTGGTDLAKEAPVSDGLLWIDPTAPVGGLSWLIPSSQNRKALLIDGDRSRLVSTPDGSHLEETRLVVEGKVGPSGELVGEVRLVLYGRAALPWLKRLESEQNREVRDAFDHFLKNWWPGAQVGAMRWARVPEAVPAVTLRAEVTAGSLAGGSGGRRWVRPPAMRSFPAPRHLEERQTPVVLSPGLVSSTFKLSLPDGWCGAEEDFQELSKSVGRFQQKVGTEDGLLVLHREAETLQQRVEGAALAELAELALAENRATRRRVRLRCPEGASEAGSALR